MTAFDLSHFDATDSRFKPVGTQRMTSSFHVELPSLRGSERIYAKILISVISLGPVSVSNAKASKLALKAALCHPALDDRP
jgi:hypothetical protein